MNKEQNQSNLDQFHLFRERRDGKREITAVYDYAIFDDIVKHQPMFILGGVPYLYRCGVYVPDLSGAMLTSMIQSRIYPVFRKSSTHKRVFDLFLRAEELQVSFEDLNKNPVYFVPFRNGLWDPVRETMIPHNPKFLAINQLPIVFDPKAKPSGKVTDQWLDSFLKNTSDREMFLQFLGYCLTRDTRQQKFLILLGEGGSGKSTPLHLLEALAGDQNINSIGLEQLTQRFSAFGLLGKLVNICADIRVTALEDVSTIKKLTGEDRVFAEAKGKDGFPFRSYAKLIFSTNELPIIENERTNGFYRRLLVLTFPKPPEYPDPELLEKLIGERDYFLHLLMDALHRMYLQGHITESPSSVQAVNRLRLDSDTVEAFLSERATVKTGERSERNHLFAVYSAYCSKEERRPLSRNSFYRALRSKGFQELRTSTGRFFCDISTAETVTKTVTERQKTVTNGAVLVTQDDSDPLPWEN